MSQPVQTAAPEGVIASYVTFAGATVEITYTSATGVLAEDCTGCAWHGMTDTDGLITDTPEQEQARVDEWLPTARREAQAHAETCRALPEPTA